MRRVVLRVIAEEVNRTRPSDPRKHFWMVNAAFLDMREKREEVLELRNVETGYKTSPCTLDLDRRSEFDRSIQFSITF